jgi:hypothetical protein
MQPHEGPGDGPGERERKRERRERVYTQGLLGVIAILSVALVITLGWRFL